MPRWLPNKMAKVVHVGTLANETSALSTLVLPAAMWAEKQGIFVNKQGRLQEFKQAVARCGNAREDWRILAESLGDENLSSLRSIRTKMNEKFFQAGELDLNKIPARGWVSGQDEGGEA